MNPTPRSIRLPWVLGLVLLVGSLMGAALFYQNSRPVEAGRNDDPKRHDENKLGLGVFCLGKVDVESGLIQLFPMQHGAVTEVFAFEGRSVTKGTPLLKVQDQPYQLKVKEAELGVRLAEIQRDEARLGIEKHKTAVAAQEAAVKLAQETQSRQKSLLARAENLLNAHIPQVSEKDVQEQRNAVSVAEAAVMQQQARLDQARLENPENLIAAAEEQVKLRQQQVEQARDAVNRCTLTAPQDGTILRVLAAVGSQYGPNSQQPAIEFAPQGPRVLRCDVDQEFANRVSQGADAVIQDEATVGPVWHGKVLRINDAFLRPRNNLGPEILTSGAVNPVLEVIVSINPSETMPRLGQRMRVSIGTR